MKIARIIPLFKSGDKQNVSNYRPISLLPQFSKILEKIFNKRLMNFLNSNNLLYLRQYGFRKNMSISLAIMELVENITNAMDNGKFTIGVFIDLKRHLILWITVFLLLNLTTTELGVLPKNG